VLEEAGETYSDGSRAHLTWSVWGRVVSDVPDFCRELVAALAEE
jgi:hypothetical protein